MRSNTKCKAANDGSSEILQVSRRWFNLMCSTPQNYCFMLNSQSIYSNCKQHSSPIRWVKVRFCGFAPFSTYCLVILYFLLYITEAQFLFALGIRQQWMQRSNDRGAKRNAKRISKSQTHGTNVTSKQRVEKKKKKGREPGKASYYFRVLHS